MSTPTVAADRAGLDRAAACLKRGLVVAIPTDTVYGLAVDATIPGATARLFEAKGRPRTVPIAVLVADESQAWNVTAAPPPPPARSLAARFWPGALTLVLTRAAGWDADLGDERRTAGVRCPAHAWVRELCRVAGPLATTSANRHGEPTPPDAAGVASALGGGLALVVDGGVCGGIPSTVLDCTVDPPVILREGALSAAALGV